MNNVFGDSTTVIDIYVLVMLLDILTGYANGLTNHNWKSAINKRGLATKFLSFSAIICGAVMDKILPLLDIQLGFSIAFYTALALILMEVGSILENYYKLGGKKLGFLTKYLGVANDSLNAKVGNETPKANEEENE